jgi:BirA family biotin operon repressor/biotin-[acetyl-CoA-carboxylase] ligase
VFNGGKLTGILTELSMKEGAVSYVVVGIGINVNNEDFPEDLRGKATSMYLETGRKWSRAELTARIFSCFEVLYGRFEAEGFASLSREYEKQLAGLGKKAVVMERKPWTGTVTGVNEDGALLIADEAGQVHVISSGEISIRGINDYSP